MRVPLPSLEIQTRNTEMRRRISGLRAELIELADHLASAFSDEALDGSEAELGALWAGDNLDAWIDRMPFPMASVLRRYRAGVDLRGMHRHLLHFFEAYAAFCSILLLSAARADPALWNGLKGKLARSGEGTRNPFHRIGFGTWINIGRTLAKVFRPDLVNADDDTRSNLLGVADETLVHDLVVGKGLWELLDRAGGIRNREAHGGGVSDLQISASLRELGELLGDLHQCFGKTFDRVRLIQPGALEYERGIHRFPHARFLQGADPVFMKGELASVSPLNHSSLYLVDAKGALETALELLPLVRLLPLPSGEGSACFVLNRVEADGTFRFISPYSAGPPLDPIADPILTELIDELSGAG